MALKRKLTKTQHDKLSDDLKKEYKADGDEFVLDVDGDEDTGALKRAKDREKLRADEAETERDELRAENEKLEKGKAGDVRKLQKAHETERTELTTKHTGELTKRDSFITRQLKTGTAERIAATLNPKSPRIFVPHLEARITVDLSGDEPKTIILGADGKPGMVDGKPMTAEQLQAEFVANKDFAGMIVGSKASGGAGATKTGGGGAPAQNNGQQPPSLATMPARQLAAEIKARKEAT